MLLIWIQLFVNEKQSIPFVTLLNGLLWMSVPSHSGTRMPNLGYFSIGVCRL